MRRVVVTGMRVASPLGNTLEGIYAQLMAGKSCVRNWRFFEDPRVYAKVGGELSDCD